MKLPPVKRTLRDGGVRDLQHGRLSAARDFNGQSPF
jgi:hypothetical protein